MEDLSKGYEAPAVFSLLLVRMIMRLQLLICGPYREHVTDFYQSSLVREAKK
jgi:hypothetical protein